MPKEICFEKRLLIDHMCQLVGVMSQISCQINKLIAAGTVPPAELEALCVELRSSTAYWQLAKAVLNDHMAKHCC